MIYLLTLFFIGCGDEKKDSAQLAQEQQEDTSQDTSTAE